MFTISACSTPGSSGVCCAANCCVEPCLIADHRRLRMSRIGCAKGRLLEETRSIGRADTEHRRPAQHLGDQVRRSSRPGAGIEHLQVDRAGLSRIHRRRQLRAAVEGGRHRRSVHQQCAPEMNFWPVNTTVADPRLNDSGCGRSQNRNRIQYRDILGDGHCRVVDAGDRQLHDVVGRRHHRRRGVGDGSVLCSRPPFPLRVAAGHAVDRQSHRRCCWCRSRSARS